MVVGTGSAPEPFANRLHSSQLAVPLTRTLLEALEEHARDHPVAPPPTRTGPVADAGTAAGERAPGNAAGGGKLAQGGRPQGGGEGPGLEVPREAVVHAALALRGLRDHPHRPVRSALVAQRALDAGRQVRIVEVDHHLERLGA